jgi:adenylate cyclase
MSFGTERYPEKVARRLRAVNLVSWIASFVTFCWLIQNVLDPTEKLLKLAPLNVLAAPLFAAIPLLHFFGPLAAASALNIAFYAYCFTMVMMLGTGSGVQLYFVVAAALTVLYFGIEQIFLSLGFGVVAAFLMAALNFLAPYDTGLQSPLWRTVAVVSNGFISCGVVILVVYYVLREMARAEETAEREYRRSETLLANILPTAIAARLKNRVETIIADKYEDASILFADMAGFTARASDTDPDDLVQFLNRVFTEFDQLVEQHGLEKIKTTGDAYVVVSGLPVPRPDQVDALACLALDMRRASQDFHDPHGRKVPMRIGMSCGPVVAGVVGKRKFFYDVWGDAVNVAARMETTDDEGKIQVSQEAYERLKEHFVLEERGWVDVKGKGMMHTWFLVAHK